MEGVTKELSFDISEFTDEKILNLITNAPVTFVTGKGGVGKTTLSNLLAHKAYLHGERTLLISLVENTQSKISFGVKGNLKPGIEPINTSHGYEVAFVTPARALAKYLNDKNLGVITSRLENSSLLEAIANIVPGMRELLIVGAIRSLAISKKWDRIIVDAPSTGHALALFNVTSSTGSLTNSGVISDQSKSVDSFLHDPKWTQVLVVSLNQHMVLEESKELLFELEDKLGLNICGIVLNKTTGSSLRKSEVSKTVLKNLFLPIYTYENKNASKTSYLRKAFGLQNKFPTHVHRKLILNKNNLCLVIGTGGVGKTTLSAAIAFSAANKNFKIGLLTIDPARRLATALGLESSEDSSLIMTSNKEKSHLHVFQLNPKAEFMRLLEKSLSKDDYEACEKNAFVNSVASMGIINEFMAIEAMHRLATSNEYDMVIIDTPPSHHLSDLLDTPDTIMRALKSPIYKAFIGAGTLTSWGANAVLKTILRPLKSLVGTDLIGDAVDFLKMIKNVEKIFSQHANEIKEMISSNHTSRIGICSTNQNSLDHIFELSELMKLKGHPLTSIVINGYSTENEDSLDEIGNFAELMREQNISTTMISEFEETLPVDIVSKMSEHIIFKS